MNTRLRTNSPEEGIRVSLTAYKSLVSDMTLRLKQAEDLANTLLSSKIPKEVFESSLVNILKGHIDARGLERNAHYLALLQTTLIALTNIQRGLKTLTPEQLDAELIEIIKALTISTNH